MALRVLCRVEGYFCSRRTWLTALQQTFAIGSDGSTVYLQPVPRDTDMAHDLSVSRSRSDLKARRFHTLRMIRYAQTIIIKHQKR
jgi:hypothetical protein